MRTSIFKTDNVFFKHYFKIYDIRGFKLKITAALLLLLFVYSVFFPAPSNYLLSLRAKYLLISFDRLYDYTVPLLAALMTAFAFFNDYKNQTYRFLGYYHPGPFNRPMVYRWATIVFLICIGSFVSAGFYYRNVSFFGLTGFFLSVRFLPNIVFLSALMLCVTALTKNSYAGLFVTLVYYILDLFSEGRLFKLFSMGANAANFYYAISPEYYLFNRLLLCLAAGCFLGLACYQRR